jgi:hypothetical protein
MRHRWQGIIAAFLILAAWETAALAADDIITFGVMEVVSKAEGVTDRQADAIRDIFTRYLANSKTIAVIERERLLSIGEEIMRGASGLIDPRTAAKIGRLAGCQYMLFGSVTGLSEKKAGGMIPLPIPLPRDPNLSLTSNVTKATIDMRVVDVTTAEVVLSLSEEGTASESSMGIDSPWVKMLQGEFSGLEARAIQAAVARLSNRILEELGGEYAYVLSVRGNSVFISRGVKSGVKKGDLYLVYANGSEIFDMDDTPIGRERLPLAVVKVVDVQSDFSNCEVASAGGKASNIRRGDKIEPISAQEAKDYAGRNVFPSGRPILGDGISSLIADKPIEKEPSLPSPAPGPGRRDTYKWKYVDGVDMNATTDAKLIEIYPLSSEEKNTMGIQHRSAYQMYTKKKYKDAFEMFSRLATDYDCNYLSAYWAGLCAVRLGSNKEAEKWFDRALSINEDYQPAIDEKAKLGDNPVNKAKKTTRGKGK